MESPTTQYTGVPRGEDHVGAKLTEAAVREMRDLHRSGLGAHRLARRFGVSIACAQRVIRRKSWKHVE
jgi:hypothetical protein